MCARARKNASALDEALAYMVVIVKRKCRWSWWFWGTYKYDDVWAVQLLVCAAIDAFFVETIADEILKGFRPATWNAFCGSKCVGEEVKCKVCLNDEIPAPPIHCACLWGC